MISFLMPGWFHHGEKMSSKFSLVLGETQSELSWNFSGISWQSLISGRRRQPGALAQWWEGGFSWGLDDSLNSVEAPGLLVLIRPCLQGCVAVCLAQLLG